MQTMRHAISISFASLLALSPAAADSMTFNLRGGDVPDGVSSGVMTRGGITATLASLVPGYLNQTTSSYGINADGSGDASAAIDAGSGVVEAVSIFFSEDVFLTGLTLSLFSSGELASLMIAGQAHPNLSDTGVGNDVFTFSSKNFVPAGQSVLLGHVSGNGFSFDGFTIDSVSVPDGDPTLALLAVPVFGLLGVAGRRMGHTR